MKKSIKILGLLAIAISAFTACTKETTIEPSAAIVGFWGINSTSTAFYIDGQLIQNDTTILATDELTLNFTTGGLAIGISKDSSGTFTNDTAYYTITGTNLVVVDKSSVPFDTTKFTTTITGNKLNMKGSQVDTGMFGITKVNFEYNGTKLVRK